MTFARLFKRYRWPLAILGAVVAAAGGGMLVGNGTVAGMDTFYANVAAADSERLARIETGPAPDDTIPIDNSLPPVEPVDLSFARATNAAVNDEASDSGR